MKIQSLHFLEVGPLNVTEINLVNDWDGQIETRALFTGPNGSGKSTALRAVAMLWEALGYWLDQRKNLPKSHASREWLQRWGGCAVILDAVLADAPAIGLLFGEQAWCEQLMKQHPQVAWIGESVARTGKPGNPKRELLIPKDGWLQAWSDQRKRLILSFDKVAIPNVLFLDAEERRWVSPRRNVGEHLPEPSQMRWLPRYIASEDWKGQLEASLITLKTTQLQTYHRVIRQMNEFLAGKEIDPDIKPGENRLRVKIKGTHGQSHSLDELSAGEHQVLILIYLISRWAEQGAVVLIDEPDLYLHPSLVSGLLASLEKLVADLGGQLIITSHLPEIWHRYEASGKRIELGAMA
ncbi:ATP-binding protein [Chromobacterium subtsugae]|uniref:ATP-binding protein n=1 Tax=Chromobacterium subtsugae TaxID=251747 RepID=UPI000641293D|nr:ATP-binding protein [Chromobacterium subtsugae]